MSLQNKFRFLLAVFGVSVVANVLISVWCIQVYVDEAVAQFAGHMSSAGQTNLARNGIDELVTDLAAYADAPDAEFARAISSRCAEVVRALRLLATERPDDPLAGERGELAALGDELSAASEQFLASVRRASMDEARATLRDRIQRGIAAQLRHRLTTLAGADDLAISNTTVDMSDTQATVTVLLAANAGAAFLLAAVGVYLVRNWVLKPVEALKTATEEHARGNLGYRIGRRSDDELGALSDAMNRMADSLIEIQKQLVQRERLAALGEVASLVAHNIRNPLAGIRASAQSAMGTLEERTEFHEQQRRLVETVDSLSQWLKQLLLVNRPLELARRSTPIREMVEAVLEAQRSNAERRHITFRYGQPDDGCDVHVDPRHVEQAIQVVVDNALDASPEHAEVAIEAVPVPGSDRWVDLKVSDRGPGLPADVRDRITSLYFTTKATGTGIGLYLARKTVESHGGQILFDSPPSGGTTVTLRLPARDVLGAPDGQDSAGR